MSSAILQLSATQRDLVRLFAKLRINPPDSPWFVHDSRGVLVPLPITPADVFLSAAICQTLDTAPTDKPVPFSQTQTQWLRMCFQTVTWLRVPNPAPLLELYAAFGLTFNEQPAASATHNTAVA